jgi:hypothetical protein
MRTKALFLTAALGAAGIATSMAQVYSVNAVGYVNLTVPKGGKFALYSNPLIAATNTYNALLGGAPFGTFVYTIGPIGYVVTYRDSFDGTWLDEMGNPAGDTRSISNGQAFLIWNPDPDNDYVITFVGEVAQGTAATGNPVVNDIPANFSMRGSKVPQSGLVQTTLGYHANGGDLFQKFNVTTQVYEVYSVDPFAAGEPVPLGNWYDPNGNPGEPSLAVGEGAVIFKPAGARNWTRDFSVN